jgi:hypothetical protein
MCESAGQGGRSSSLPLFFFVKERDTTHKQSKGAGIQAWDAICAPTQRYSPKDAKVQNKLIAHKKQGISSQDEETTKEGQEKDDKGLSPKDENHEEDKGFWSKDEDEGEDDKGLSPKDEEQKEDDQELSPKEEDHQVSPKQEQTRASFKAQDTQQTKVRIRVIILYTSDKHVAFGDIVGTLVSMRFHFPPNPQ